MTPVVASYLIAAGAVAGAVNAVAGGGSLLTIPLLAAVGIPASEANATNRVGVLMQAFSSTAVFARGAVLERGDGAMVPVCLAGAAAGAVAATMIPPRPFEVVVGAVFALAAAALARELWWSRDEGRAVGDRHVRGAARWLMLLAVGFYGGFLQAGVGVFIVLVLHRIGSFSLLRAHAIKAVLVLAWTALALGVFAARGHVHWEHGLVLGAGGVVGAWAGARWAVHVPQRPLKGALLCATVVAAWSMLRG